MQSQQVAEVKSQAQGAHRTDRRSARAHPVASPDLTGLDRHPRCSFLQLNAVLPWCCRALHPSQVRVPPTDLGRFICYSAGKSKDNGSTGHGNRYPRVLGEAAVIAGRTDTFLGARYRRIARPEQTETQSHSSTRSPRVLRHPHPGRLTRTTTRPVPLRSAGSWHTFTPVRRSPSLRIRRCTRHQRPASAPSPTLREGT